MSYFALKKVVLGAIAASAFTIVSSSAFAACDTATITGNCSKLTLPSAAGNVDYVVDAGAVVTSDDAYKAISIEAGTIGSFTNNGQIGSSTEPDGHNGLRISASGVVNGDFVNNGSMLTARRTTFEQYGTVNGDIINNGTIEFFGGPLGEWEYAFLGYQSYSASFINSATGIIRSNSQSAFEIDQSTINTFNNAGLMEHVSSGTNWGPAVGLWTSDIGTFINSGTITDSSSGSSNNAIRLAADYRTPSTGSTIGTLVNSGEISATTSGSLSAIYVNNLSSVGTLTNTGDIWTAGSGYYGIENKGSINALNNFQGTTGSYGSALTLRDNLPSYYNMIAYGDAYGQLSVNDLSVGSGAMMFGIFGGDSANGIAASQLKSGVYENVVMGAVQSDFSNNFDTSDLITSKFGLSGAAFGNYNGVAWMLTDATYREGDGLAWDLTTFSFGLDLAEPQRAMLEQRQQSIRNGIDHDCAQFDKDGLCVSFKARYSGFGDEHEGAGVLTVAKRIDTGLRIGAFVDERVTSNEVNGVQLKSGLPMFGIFAAYTAHQDGTGLQARVAAAYEHGTADFNRSNLLGSASVVKGKANVDSYGVAQRLGWGFGLDNKNVLTPYLGIRYTEAKRSAYNEAYSAGSVDDPFSYAAYGEHRVTGTLGADLEGPLSKDVTYRLGAGVDYDFANHLDTFAAYSDLFGDMTYTNGFKARDMRLFGLAGIGYAIEPNRTLTLDGNISQMDYGNDAAYSLMAGYRMAF